MIYGVVNEGWGIAFLSRFIIIGFVRFNSWAIEKRLILKKNEKKVEKLLDAISYVIAGWPVRVSCQIFAWHSVF
jgi:hypothetical protein